MYLSVVIPSYNGGEKLAVTIDSILKNQTVGLEYVEIIVVDDGSPNPVEPFLNYRQISPPFSLSIIRQPNAGPAAARNSGFRAARGDIVIFIDDDILCPDDLIANHVTAHTVHPASVIFGVCPLIEPGKETPFYRYVALLYQSSNSAGAKKFSRAAIVASGHLSLERAMFDSQHGIYNEALVTPAAEEFALSHYLQKKQIPLYMASWIVARHNQSVELSTMCHQQYKHGLGCAEVSIKQPETRELKQLEDVICSVGPIRANDSLVVKLKKRFLELLGGRWARNSILDLVKRFEALFPVEQLLRPLYHLTISLYFSAGVRDGFIKFSAKSAPGVGEMGASSLVLTDT